MPDQFEKYYKYLKDNGADVAPDFNSFKNTLSDYNNASKYYTYLKDNKFDVPETYDLFADTFGLKKKVGGAISSLTELPSEFIEPLKKGVSPNQTKEEARLVKQLGIKPMTGVAVPTNLPKQDEMRYERELKTQDAAINTLTDIYKQKGLKFDPNKPAAQKQIQDYIEQERSSDLARVTGKDGKEYLTRGQGFIEAGAKALVHSVVEPFQSAEINFTNTPSELADLLDKKIAEEPNVPESAPTKVGGYMGGLLGGLPKLMGLLAVPYFGEAAMVTEMYHNAVANERRALYERGIRSKENGGEGLDREAAAKMAMETAPITAVPDAAMGLVLARGVGGKNILPEAEKKAFKDALAPFKDVAKVAGLGGVAGSSKALLELGSGYDVTATEVLERGGKSVGEYALMDGAFKLMHKAGTIAGVGLRASKAVVSAAKNLLSSVPKEILEVQAEKYPDGKEIVQKVQEFAKVKDEVKDLVPPEKVGSVAGLTEKIKTIQADMEELAARKEKTTDALKPQIDEWLKEYQDEIDFYNNQIKKVIKSKDPSGILEEIDDVTGEKIGAKKYIVDGKEVSQGEFEAIQGKPKGTKEIVEPAEIKGLKVIKRVEDAGGEAVYEVEGERFLTADGKELKVAKVELPEKTKPVEVKEVKAEVEPTEINGLKVIKKIDEDIYQVEPQKLPASGGGEAFFTKYYTSDGREVLVPEEVIKKAEAKAIAVDVKRIVEPSKPISEMNSEELGIFATETKKALKKQDKDFEGKTEKEKEDGGYYDVIDEVEDLRDASERANFIENAENINDLANSVKSTLSNIKRKEPNEYQLAILNAAKNKAIELGIDSKDLIKNISSKIANQYKDVEDAEIMVKSALEKLIPTKEVKPAELKTEPDIRKELRSQIDKKEIELIEKQQSDIDKAKRDLKEIENDNQEVISEYVKKSGYKLITKDTINPSSKGGEKFPESDIGKYYKFTGSSLIRNSAKNLALKGAEAKAKSTPQGSKAGMNKYSNAFDSVKDYENGNINKNQFLKIIKDSGLDIEKFETFKPKVEKQVEPKILSIDNKEYTTKTGRQKVVLKDNDLKVIDIKTGKEASPATRRKALDEYVERYDFSKGKTAQENTKEAPQGLSSEEVDRFSIEQSENPLEVASAYIYEEPISKFSGSKDAMIAEFGVGKVTQESFKRWKDENLITGGMALTYFNKKEGLPLDVLAKSMSDHYGKEIDPQDIAEFIVKYPSGSSAALRDIESPTGRMAAERFKELTGLDLYRGMAEKIVKAEYEKRKQIEKDLIKEEYETAKQLEDAYWAAYKETDGFTKESPVSKVKPSEAAEKSVEEAYKDLTINQKRQIINSKFDELLKELKIEKICPT